MTTELAIPETGERQGAFELIVALEQSGAATKVALTFTDTSMPYETWEAVGRVLGEVKGSSMWWIGDWLNAGEALYGEDYAQAIEDTQETRYSQAERVTGLDHGTLMNLKSVAGRVDKDIRRWEVAHSMHADLAALAKKDQKKWLKLIIKNGWTRSDLRLALREAYADPAAEDDAGQNGAGGVTVCERIQEVAQAILATAQPTGHGTHEVQDEQIAQLRAAFGQE